MITGVRDYKACARPGYAIEISEGLPVINTLVIDTGTRVKMPIKEAR